MGTVMWYSHSHLHALNNFVGQQQSLIYVLYAKPLNNTGFLGD